MDKPQHSATGRCAAAFLLSAPFLAALLFATVPARADVGVFQYQGCDGYAAPDSEGDGMTTRASILGRLFGANGDRHQYNMAEGGTGIADCDAAIAVIPAKYWMRKVDLLRARAAHKLAVGDVKGAMADLDLADAAVQKPDDPYYARSLGVGLGLLRAYAERRAGDEQKAETLAIHYLSERPYNRESGAGAMMALGFDASLKNKETVFETLSRLEPTQIDYLFRTYFDASDYDAAIKLFPQLVAPHEIGRVNITSTEKAEREWRDFRTSVLFWTTRTGLYAYALAATGRDADARAAIAGERAKIAGETEPPPPLSPEDARDSDEVALHKGLEDIHAREAKEGKVVLDAWDQLVNWRIMVSNGQAAQVIRDYAKSRPPKSWALAELFTAVNAKLPKAQRMPDQVLAALRKELANSDMGKLDMTPDELLKNLPSAETPDNLPTFEEATEPLFASKGSEAALDSEGYQSVGPDSDGVLTVSFRAHDAPRAAVEEMALLRVAQIARKEGKKGIIVVGREDVQYEINNYMYGTKMSTAMNGFRTGLDVIFVDPAALPDKYKSAPWRVLDADAVYNALAPFYLPKPKTDNAAQ